MILGYFNKKYRNFVVSERGKNSSAFVFIKYGFLFLVIIYWPIPGQNSLFTRLEKKYLIELVILVSKCFGGRKGQYDIMDKMAT